jgi:hypothetical protein
MFTYTDTEGSVKTHFSLLSFVMLPNSIGMLYNAPSLTQSYAFIVYESLMYCPTALALHQNLMKCYRTDDDSKASRQFITRIF